MNELVHSNKETDKPTRRKAATAGSAKAAPTRTNDPARTMAEILAVKNGVKLPRDMEVSVAKDGLALAHNDSGALVCGMPRAGD